MVDFARVQNRIYYGYSKAAQRLGTSHAVYRSTDGNNPIQSGNLIGNQLISVDQNLKYTSVKKYGDPVWQFLPEDGLSLKNYDYLVGASVTYFIADVVSDDRLSPPICVECNGVITITRPSNESTLTPGKNNYQQLPLTQPQIITGCPVSILQFGRFDASTMKLPTSVRLPMYSINLPEFNNILIKPGDLIEDDNGRRLAVLSAERSKKALGFRIIAAEQGV